MKVKASPGLRVPKERAPRQYITDQSEVEVPATAYYVRRVMQGDLIDVDASPSTAEGTTANTAAADSSVAAAGDKKNAKGA